MSGFVDARVGMFTRLIFRAMAILLACGFSLAAHATSTCNDTNNNNPLVAGTLSVPVNAAPGMTVATLSPVNFIVQCRFTASGTLSTSTVLHGTLSTPAPLAAGFTDVYVTNVAGIGVRYTLNSSSAQCNLTNATVQNGSLLFNCPFSGPLGGPYVQYSIMITASLIVTGTIAAGASTLSSAPVLNYTLSTDDSPGPWPQAPAYSGAASGIITQATCSVSQTNVSVIMPTADTRAFPANGAVGAPQTFSLALSCHAGATVLITLTDAVNPANRGTTLQLTQDSTAKGIGVQILNGSGAPVGFGADSATPGNVNQWSAGLSPNGALVIPLTARYIRNGAVSAGTVKALATFTMSYQ